MDRRAARSRFKAPRRRILSYLAVALVAVAGFCAVCLYVHLLPKVVEDHGNGQRSAPARANLLPDPNHLRDPCRTRRSTLQLVTANTYRKGKGARGGASLVSHRHGAGTLNAMHGSTVACKAARARPHAALAALQCSQRLSRRRCGASRRRGAAMWSDLSSPATGRALCQMSPSPLLRAARTWTWCSRCSAARIGAQPLAHVRTRHSRLGARPP